MFWDSLQLMRHFFVPQICPTCLAEVTAYGLCSDCWHQADFISDNACDQCGGGFDFPLPDRKCQNCVIDAPHFDSGVAAAVYSDPIRKMILALKHGDRQEIAPILGMMMLAKTYPLLQRADFILPLPLHRTRFFSRRYNQSAELAKYLMARGNIDKGKMNTRILIRHKRTPPQGKKTKAQRIEAMRNAFSVPAKQQSIVRGSRVLIIDDVMTTGASLSSAAKALKRAGACHVAVSVAARV